VKDLVLDPWDLPCAGVPAGSPVNLTDLSPGRAVEWLEIHADGAEGARRGRVWAPAPPLAGMSAWWVMPDIAFPRRLTAPGGALLAVRASRRHQVGRRTPEGRWRARGGRFVDVGTLYVHTDPASPQGDVLARARAHPGPARAIRMRPLPLDVLRGLSGWYLTHGLGIAAERLEEGY
jgi:hypothetical protein